MRWVEPEKHLRVIELAAKNSCALQAVGMAATVYELCHAVAFIAGNDDRASKWESHEEPSRSYPSSSNRRKAVRATIRTFVPESDVEAMVDHQEDLYTVFCVAKHGHPRLLKRFGVAVEDDRVQLYHGPFVAPYVVRQARFALLNASWIVTGATAVFAKPLLGGASASRRGRYDRLDRAVGDLILRLRESRLTAD